MRYVTRRQMTAMVMRHAYNTWKLRERLSWLRGMTWAKCVAESWNTIGCAYKIGTADIWKNVKQVNYMLSDVIKEVRESIREAITDGYDWMDYEKDFARATINIRMRVVEVRGRMIDDVDVFITHDDERHSSPLLTRALSERLPRWQDVVKEMREEDEEYIYR